MCSSTISIQYSYVNIACITLYCVLIESLLSVYSITGDTDRTLTGQSIALYGIVYYVSMLYSRQIQPVCIWSALYHGKVLQTFSKCNLSNIAHKSAHVFKMVFPLQKPPQGGIKIFPNIAENPNKISVQSRSENASQKSTLGAVKFVSEYFFLTDIFRYTSFFSIFMWKFEISSQKSISNCISTQLCQQII